MTPPHATLKTAAVRNAPKEISSVGYRPFSDPNRLAPEDAFYANSPPRRQRERVVNGAGKTNESIGSPVAVRAITSSRRRREKERGRSKSRRRQGVWKKLLWVKHPGCAKVPRTSSYPLYTDFAVDPDNYTDPPTFLSHLQLNPHLLPYDFWPLVADSTVIVQHVCSVAIFVCCFVGIFQERVSPISVVSWGSAWTVLGWVFWDFWAGQEEATRSLFESTYTPHNAISAVLREGVSGGDEAASVRSGFSSINDGGHEPLRGLGLMLNTSAGSTRTHSRNLSSTSSQTASDATSPVMNTLTAAPQSVIHSYSAPYNAPASTLSLRNQQRLATAKSAILIYCALLGLSPILKSLTKSTTSDSIWALSCWLMCINVFFFDYGGGVGVKYVLHALAKSLILVLNPCVADKLANKTLPGFPPPSLQTQPSWLLRSWRPVFPAQPTSSPSPSSPSKSSASSLSSAAISAIVPGASMSP